MRALLLASLAALGAAALAAPAQAQFTGDPGVSAGSFAAPPDFHRDHRRDGDFRRRHRGFGGVVYLDREYQGDTGWRHDSFNDWWHERSERSYPRWIQNNANCERKWWAGDTLRC